jgi:hypothetical protein
MIACKSKQKLSKFVPLHLLAGGPATEYERGVGMPGRHTLKETESHTLSRDKLCRSRIRGRAGSGVCVHACVRGQVTRRRCGRAPLRRGATRKGEGMQTDIGRHRDLADGWEGARYQVGQARRNNLCHIRVSDADARHVQHGVLDPRDVWWGREHRGLVDRHDLDVHPRLSDVNP